MARDERRAVRAQPDDGFGYFLRLADAAHGVETGEEFGNSSEGSGDHVGFDDGGAYGVETDPGFSILDGRRFGEPADAALSGETGGAYAAPSQACDAGHLHHRPSPLTTHVLCLTSHVDT